MEKYIQKILNSVEIKSYLEYLYVVMGENDIRELQDRLDSQDVLDNWTKTNFENELNSDFEEWYDSYYSFDINLELERMIKSQKEFNENKQYIINQILNN